MLRRPKFKWQADDSPPQKRNTGESQTKGSSVQEHDIWNSEYSFQKILTVSVLTVTDCLAGSTWDINMSGKRTSTAMKSVEKDDRPTSYGRANSTWKRQRSSTRGQSESSLDAQPKHKKFKHNPVAGVHKRSKKPGHVPVRYPREASSDDEVSEDAEPVPEVVSDVIPRRGLPVLNDDDIYEHVPASPANSDSESDHEANEEDINSGSESGSTEDEAEQLRMSVARPMVKSTDPVHLGDDTSSTKSVTLANKLASEDENEDKDSADDSSASRNAEYAAAALSNLSVPRTRNHVSADSNSEDQDPGLEDTVAYSQPTERESEEDAESADAAQIGASDQHTSSPNSIFDPTERSMAPSTAAPVHAAKRKKKNKDKGVSTSEKRHKRGVYSPPTSNSPEADDGLATNSKRPRTIQGTFSINCPAKSKKSRSAKTQVQEDQRLVDLWVKPLSLDATYKHPMFNPTPRKQVIAVELTNLCTQSAVTSSNPRTTTRPSGRGRRSTKFKSSERIQDSSDDEGDQSRVRRTLAYSDRKGKGKAQPGINYTWPPKQAARVTKRTPAEDGSEDGSDPASDNDASYRTAQSFHTETPNSNAVDIDDALDSSDSRPEKRSKVTGRRISVRRVGTAAVGRGKTGAFDSEEVSELDKFRDDFCIEHAITVQTFNSMMEDTSKGRSGHKWPWDRYISKRALIDDYYNVLPSRDKRSLRRYKDRWFTNLEQKAAWTNDDDEMLMEMVKEKGTKWKAIGQELGRTDDAVHQRYKHKLRHGDKAQTGTWTNEEIEALESAIEFCKSKAGTEASGNELEVNWTEVSDRMGGTRTAQQCARHWRRVQKEGERPIRYAYASTTTPKTRPPKKPKKNSASGKASVRPGKTGTEESSKSKNPVKPLDIGGDDSDDPIEDEGPVGLFASATIPKGVKKTSQESIDTTQDTSRVLDQASDQDQPPAQEAHYPESERGEAYQGSDTLGEENGMSQHADDDAQDGDEAQDEEDDDDEQVEADIGRQLGLVPKNQEEALPIQTEVAVEVPPDQPQEPDFDDAWAQQEAWQREQEGKLVKGKAERIQKEGKRKKTTAGNPTQPTSSVVETASPPQPQQAVEQQDRTELQEALWRGLSAGDRDDMKADQPYQSAAVSKRASRHGHKSAPPPRREQTTEATQGDWQDWNDSDEAISVVDRPVTPSPDEANPESGQPGLRYNQESQTDRGAPGRPTPCLKCKSMHRKCDQGKPCRGCQMRKTECKYPAYEVIQNGSSKGGRTVMSDNPPCISCSDKKKGCGKEKPSCLDCQKRNIRCEYPAIKRALLHETPGKVTNLTQAFATTQAPMSALRAQQSQRMEIVATQSDRPSPNIGLKMHPELSQGLLQSQTLGGPQYTPVTQDKADVDEIDVVEDNASTSSDEKRGVSDVVVVEEQDEAIESHDEEESGSDDEKEDTGSEEVSGSDAEEDSNDSMVKATRVDYARSRVGKDARSEFTKSIKNFADKQKKTSQRTTWGRKAPSDSDEDDDEDE